MITPEEFAEEMYKIATSDDPRYYDCEPRHIEADSLMCAVLEQFGYGKGVKFFEAMGKWYA